MIKEDHRRTEDSWHLDKKVPISLILGLILQSAMVIYAFVDLRKDVDHLKLQVVAQVGVDQKQDADRKEDKTYLIAVLQTLDAKLDRLIERGLRK